MFANEPAKEMYGWPLHFLAKYLVWSADYYDCRFGKQTFYFSTSMPQRSTIEKHILWIKCTKIRFDKYTKKTYFSI